MRRLTCSMSCATFAVLSLVILFGCSKNAERGEQSRSTTSAPASPLAESQNETSTSTDLTQANPAKTDVSKTSSTNAESTITFDSKPEPAATTPSEPAESTNAEKPPAKPKRNPIYDEKANAQELIAKAVGRAKRDHKQVLIEWGGNWCGWCHLLHDTFTKVPAVAKIVYEEYELVLIDSNSNQELLKEYAGKHQVRGFPHLTVLDAEGKVLTNQDTEPLEKGKGHDPEAVTKFLSEWTLPKVDAEQLLAEQIEKAKQDDKRILFRVGDPYCGWCKVLSQFVQDHESLLAKDYVDVKIDTTRMTNGEKVAESHRPSGAQGHPWFIILDASGTVLATSVGAKGNIGYPFQPDEISHAVKMFRETRKSLSDDEIASMETDLNEFRIKREQKQAEEKRTHEGSN